MTNKFNFLVLLAVVGMYIVFCSCRNKTEEDFLTIETTRLVFTSVVNSRDIPCASNAEIKATSSQPAWCTATIAKDGKSIVVRAEKNEGVGAEQVRAATVTVTAGKAKAVQIEVKQMSEDAMFTVIADTELKFECNADERWLKMQTNVPLKISSDQKWCTAETQGQHLIISVTANNTLDERTAEVTIIADGFDDVTISVTQRMDGHCMNKDEEIHKLPNNLYVREFEYYMDPNPNAKIEIIQISDLHINYIHPNEINAGNPTLDATNIGRTFMKINNPDATPSQGSIPSIQKAMAYAAGFDQTIITGDAIDILSYGALDLMKRYVWDVDPNVLIVLGNHEIRQAWSDPWTETLQIWQRMQMLEAYWRHDMNYYSKLLKNKVLCVVLNNADGPYIDSQAKQLAADIQRARENGYIILIFQHQPISTGNPAHKSVLPVTFETAESNMKVYNFYNATGGPGSTGATKAVYDLITDSADVIKGVFVGHEHADYSVKINASRGATIPQCVLTANMYNSSAGHVLKISINYRKF